MAEEKDPGEQAKEAAEGLKSSDKSAADLRSAIDSVNRSVQQMSDTQKAIAQQMKDQNSTVKEQDVTNKAILATLAEINSRASENKQMSEQLVGKHKELLEIQIKEKELTIGLATEQEKLREGYVKITKEGEARNKADKKAAEDMQDMWSKGLRSIEEYQKALAKTSPMTAGLLSTAARGLTGGKDLAGATSSMMSAIGGLAGTAGGIGGLLGMFFYGKMKEAEFTAIGQTAAQQFDQIGGHTDKFAGRMTSLVKNLSLAGAAAKEDMAAVAAGFASTGVSAAQAQEKIEGFSSAFGDDLLIASLAADKALELPAGSFARLSGTLAKDFNVTAKEAFISLQNLNGATRELGLSEVTFMQQSMEAASSLRLLNANAESVMTTQLSMAKAMRAAGFSVKGADGKMNVSAFGGEYAAAGTAQAAGAVANMSEGLKAVIGEMVYGKKGLAGIYAMESPLGRNKEEQLNLPKVLDAMASLFKLNKDDENYRPEMAKALKSTYGMDAAGADTVMSIAEDIRLGKEISKEQQDKLNISLMSESKKTSSIVLLLENIKQAIADTVVGLMMLVIDGLKMIYNGIMYAYNSIMEMWKNKSGPTPEGIRHGKLANLYFSNMEENVSTSDIHKEAVVAGIVGIMAQAKKYFEKTIDNDAREKANNEAIKRLKNEIEGKGQVGQSMPGETLEDSAIRLGYDTYKENGVFKKVSPKKLAAHRASQLTEAAKAAAPGSSEADIRLGGTRIQWKLTGELVGTDNGVTEYGTTPTKQ
jgi:hypothetical protein